MGISIDEMKAGRQLDALVAEKVMQLPGLERGDGNKYCGIIGFAYPQSEGEYYCRRDGFLSDLIPCYSTDMAAAWQTVNEIKQDYQVCFVLEDFQFDGKYWQAMFKGGLNQDEGRWSSLYYSFADTPELAICRAALKVATNDVSYSRAKKALENEPTN